MCLSHHAPLFMILSPVTNDNLFLVVDVLLAELIRINTKKKEKKVNCKCKCLGSETG